MVLSGQLSVHGYNKTNRRAWPGRQLPRAAWVKVLAWSKGTIITDTQGLNGAQSMRKGNQGAVDQEFFTVRAMEAASLSGH
jgi:hypothetical protein